MGAAVLLAGVLGWCVNCLAAMAFVCLGMVAWETTGLDLGGPVFGVRWLDTLFSPAAWVAMAGLMCVPVGRAMGVWGGPISEGARRLAWLGALALCLAVPIGAVPTVLILFGPCSDEIVDPVVSLDRRWSAALVVRHCGATVSDRTTVLLAPSNRALNVKTDRLLGYGEAARGVGWRGDRLQIQWDYGEGEPPRRTGRGVAVDFPSAGS